MPERIGRHVVLGAIGEGAMGVVYAAYDADLDRKVAIKVLHHDRREGSSGRARLMREAKALAQLSHPNVVQVYEVGEHGQNIYLVMEFIAGPSLREWLRARHAGGMVSWEEILTVFVQAGRGLAAAHSAGLVHRDFKPSNVVVGEDGRVRVLDFGLARRSPESGHTLPSRESVEAARPDSSASYLRDSAINQGLTVTGSIVGTPVYMSPEQHHGKPVDALSDQFSFCAALYEGLCGVRVFSGRTLETLLLNKVNEHRGERAASCRAPLWLVRAICRGLKPDPAYRWPSMDALLEELVRGLEGSTRRWWSFAVVATVGLSVGVAAMVVGETHEEPCADATSIINATWSEARAAGVRATFRDVGVPYAADTTARLLPRLDRYAVAWREMYTDACEATHVKGTQSAAALDLRMECLQVRRHDLESLVSVFEDADADVVQRALLAVDELPRVERCADTEALRERVAPPADPIDVARVDEMRRVLSTIRAERAAGRYHRALAKISEPLAAAQALGYEPLLAEIKFERSLLLRFTGELEASREVMLECWWSALRSRHTHVAVNAAGQLARQVSNSGEADGRVWLGNAQALLDAGGGDERDRIALLINRGAVEKEADRFDESRDAYVEAIARERALEGEDTMVVAMAQLGLGLIHQERGEYTQAVEALERSLAIRVERMGPAHPRLWSAYLNVGQAYQALGNNGRALEQLRRGAALLEESVGENAPGLPALENAIGNTELLAGNNDRALAHFQRALELYERRWGPRGARVGTAHSNIGEVYRRKGQLKRAREHLHLALEIRERGYGPTHLKVAYPLLRLSRVALEEGRLADAEAHARRALEIRERALGPDNFRVAYALQILGELAVTRGEPRAALEPLQRAEHLLNAQPGEEKTLAEARFAMARALAAIGDDRERALALARRAQADLGNTTEDVRALRDELERWLERNAP